MSIDLTRVGGTSILVTRKEATTSTGVDVSRVSKENGQNPRLLLDSFTYNLEFLWLLVGVVGICESWSGMGRLGVGKIRINI